MASPCAHCGSVETMAGLDEFQCLACGRQTKADGTPVTPDPVFAEPGYPDRRYRPGDIIPQEPGVATVTAEATETAQVVTPVATPAPPAPVEAPPTPDPVDLSTLSPEQVAAIELIAHPEGS